MQKVFLTEHIHQDAVSYLKEAFEVVQGTSVKPEDIIQQAQGCGGILIRSAHITAEIMDALPELKVVAKHGMGVDNIDVDHATAKGIQIVNAPYSNLNAVAEHIVMLVLALSKRTVRMDRLTRKGEFAQRNAFQTIELKDSTIGIIGMGKISRMVVKKLSGFDTRMIASDPFVEQKDVEGLPVTMVSAEEVYRTADFVIVHTSLFPSTFHLVGAKEFEMMKPSAFVINAARGPVIDEAAMIEALKAGKIAGAGLDVFEQEPPSAGNPLFSMENVILSPHNAALSAGALRAMAMDSALGVREVLEGKTVTYPVNKL
ncbi:MAG: hydroxyacid dehydrogenase [Oscillibacter sp.]|nr:hydroxyacid dehydrogenase [Oscillibacter sp.]